MNYRDMLSRIGNRIQMIMLDRDAMRLVIAIFVILGFVLAFMVSIFSCQEFYIGKTEEELYREMFEVDSLISKIQFMID